MIGSSPAKCKVHEIPEEHIVWPMPETNTTGIGRTRTGLRTDVARLEDTGRQ